MRIAVRDRNMLWSGDGDVGVASVSLQGAFDDEPAPFAQRLFTRGGWCTMLCVQCCVYSAGKMRVVITESLLFVVC